MQECIKKIFGDPTSGGGTNSAPSIKSEPVFQSDHNEDVNYTSGMSGYRSWRGRRRGRGRSYGMNDGSRQDVPTSGTNPVDRDGKILKCFNCGSMNHFSRSCPTRRNGRSDMKTQDIHITLFNGKSDEHMTGLVKECIGKALLDSACTKTVCGATWLDLYMDTLSDDDKALVEVSKSDTMFRFGDGVEVMSSKLVKLPALIGHQKVMISTQRCQPLVAIKSNDHSKKE